MEPLKCKSLVIDDYKVWSMLYRSQIVREENKVSGDQEFMRRHYKKERKLMFIEHYYI